MLKALTMPTAVLASPPARPQQQVEKLPKRCFTRCPRSGNVMEIRRGELGLHPTGRNFDIDEWHRREQISPEQVAAMVCGARNGWDVPGADVDLVRSLALSSAPGPGYTLTVLPDSDYVLMRFPPGSQALCGIRSRTLAAVTEVTLLLALAQNWGWRVEAQREISEELSSSDLNRVTLKDIANAALDNCQRLLNWVVADRMIRRDLAEREQARIGALRRAAAASKAHFP